MRALAVELLRQFSSAIDALLATPNPSLTSFFPGLTALREHCDRMANEIDAAGEIDDT